MWIEQKKVLDTFYKRYGMFRVAANTRHGWTYFNYKSDDAILVLKGDGITDRDIMKDEIVIESDLNMRKMNMGLSLQQRRTKWLKKILT